MDHTAARHTHAHTHTFGKHRCHALAASHLAAALAAVAHNFLVAQKMSTEWPWLTVSPASSTAWSGSCQAGRHEAEALCAM